MVATFAIGDVHGNVDALRDLLAKLLPHVATDDDVVFLGDYIDRGADSKACIDEILSFRHRVEAAVTCLLGNHEEWLLATMDDYSRHSWMLGMEGITTVRSYSERAAWILLSAIASTGPAFFMDHAPLPYETFFDAMPEAHRLFLRSLPRVHVTADAICAHAGLDPSVPTVDGQAARAFTWGAPNFPDGYVGETPVVYGHFNNAVLDASGWPHPRMVANTIGIDTIAHGVLTAVRLPDLMVFQSTGKQGVGGTGHGRRADAGTGSA